VSVVSVNLLGISNVSAKVSMILDRVEGRWIEFSEGRMGVLAMETLLVAVHPVLVC